MSYSVFARRYRPQTFEEVVGQEHVATTLLNSIAENRVGHAYLFCGPRGVGKTSMARIFAKALNCVKGPIPTPCNTCESCQRTAEGTDSDVIEMDAASNGLVEDARTLRENVHYAPLRSRFKVYIIDESHMLSNAASNALLKTLEEPPPHVKFFFATTVPEKMLDTIRSRCQRFDFRRITTVDVVNRLKQVCKQESAQVQEEALTAIARASGGSMRDAQSLLDQLTAYTSGPVTLQQVRQMTGLVSGETCSRIVHAVKAADVRTILEELDRVFTAGMETAVFLKQLMDRFRAALIVKACGAESPLLDLTTDERAQVAKEAELFSIESILSFSQILMETSRRLKEGMDPRVVLEMALVKMTRSADRVSLPEPPKQIQHAPPAPVSRPQVVSQPPPPVAGVKKKEAVEVKPAPVVAPPANEEDVPESGEESPVLGPLTIELLRDQWHRVAEDLRNNNHHSVAGFLREGRVERLQGDDVVVVFARTHNYHKLQFDNRENRFMVEAVLNRVFGRKVSLHCEFEAAAETSVKPLPSSPKADPFPTGTPAAAPRPVETILEPNVKRLIQTFEGKIVNLEG